jgi:hypothetical protein
MAEEYNAFYVNQLEDEDSRAYLKKVALASKNIVENCPNDILYDTLEMLGLGNVKYTNLETTKRVRGYDYASSAVRKKFTEVSPRVRLVRMRALSMDWLAPY